MTMQAGIDLFSAADLRDAGIAKHFLTDQGQAYIALARVHAKTISKEKGWVDINDVRERAGNPPETCKPTIMGAVFRTKDFQFLGYFKSERRISHGRQVARFRYVGKP